MFGTFQLSQGLLLRTAMPFDALDEDILLNVLSLCDVYTTLSVSAVCTDSSGRPLQVS
jgi:hypothetical protein